jgi:hypothetical protein
VDVEFEQRVSVHRCHRVALPLLLVLLKERLDLLAAAVSLERNGSLGAELEGVVIPEVCIVLAVLGAW